MKSIKEWSHDDQPRNKLLIKGIDSLSDAEIIAILIGNGTREFTAVDLARNILNRYPLNGLGRASVSDLMKFNGIGEAKAISILAALELGRRRQSSTATQGVQINSSQDAYNLLAPGMQDLSVEVFKVILFNRSNRVIKIEMISQGGVAGTVVDPKVVFKTALECLACGIILAHNHPSGNLKPSQADLQLTSKLVQAGDHIDVKVMDHLIISHLGYKSFADDGMI